MPFDKRGRHISNETIAMGTSHGESAREKEIRQEVRLKPLDPHYGQRYLQYERAKEVCEVCDQEAVVKINGTLLCDKHFIIK